MAEQRDHVAAYDKWLNKWLGLQAWCREPLGKLYMETEAALLAEVLPSLFGYYIVALGMPAAYDLLAASPIAHRCRVDFLPYPRVPQLDVVAGPVDLPIASDSIDVVVVPHLLEFVAEPHAVLREVDRILIPEGHLLILGFNPFSLWGLWRLLHFYGRKTPWDARPLSMMRVRDWLALLGFESRAVRYYFYRPPLKHLSLLRKLAFFELIGTKGWPPLGGGYLMLAKKRVSTLTPVKPRWRVRRRLLTQGIVKPSLRKFRRDKGR
jgi:SAM-dependent methyltransferase